MNPYTVVDIRPFHDLCLQAFNIVHLNPKVCTHSLGAVHPFGRAKEEGILAVISVKTAQCHFPVFCLRRQTSGMIKGQRVSQNRLFPRPLKAAMARSAVKARRFQYPDGV